MFTKEPEWYESHHKHNKSLLEEYKTNMSIFLSRLQIPKDTISHKITIKNNPLVSLIKYPSPGNMEVHEQPLLDTINEITSNQYIITPSGSVYHPAKVKESHFTPLITERKSLRKTVKKEMAQYEAKGKKHLAKLKHYEQLKIKVGINAISGVANRNVYFKSTPCYNSITSTARHNVMCGYVSIERLLMSNFYFPNFNDTINHIVLLLRLYPGDEIIKNIIQKYNLKIPTSEQINTFLKRCTYEYLLHPKTNKVFNRLIDSLSEYERVFIYYAYSLHHIFIDNQETFKPYLKSCFDFSNIDEKLKSLQITIDENISLSELDDQDLLITLVTFSYKLLQGKTLGEIDKEYPDIKSTLIKYYKYLKYKLSWLNELFDTFIFIYLNVHKPFEHPNMIRKCVVLSDTDSNIFTTIFWIFWYTQDIVINDNAIQIHSLLVYFVTKFVEHMLALACKECNIDTKRIKWVSMKNEYFYPVFIRTTMSKHYFGNIMIKEGVVLPKYKFDFKGKNFKGSDLSPEILDIYKNFAKNIMSDIEKHYELDPNELINEVIKYELMIYYSLQNRENTFLFNVPIKNKNEYKDYIISHYFNYMLWEEVFADKYEHLTIPAKMKVVSLQYPIKFKMFEMIETDKKTGSQKYRMYLDKLRSLKNKYPAIYKKLYNFLSKYPKKEINLMLIPTTVPIPKEILHLIDYRSIIERNLFGLYLMLRSFGIIRIETPSKQNMLFSEIYKHIEL